MIGRELVFKALLIRFGVFEAFAYCFLTRHNRVVS